MIETKPISLRQFINDNPKIKDGAIMKKYEQYKKDFYINLNRTKLDNDAYLTQTNRQLRALEYNMKETSNIYKRKQSYGVIYSIIDKLYVVKNGNRFGNPYKILMDLTHISVTNDTVLKSPPSIKLTKQLAQELSVMTKWKKTYYSDDFELIMEQLRKTSSIASKVLTDNNIEPLNVDII